MQRRRWFGLLSTLLLLVALAIPAGAQDSVVHLEPLTPAPIVSYDGAMVDESVGLWFVELASAPASEGTNKNTLSREKANFRSAAAKAGIAYEERFAYDTLFNGFSIAASPTQLGAISRLAGVKAIWPVVTVDRPETRALGDPDMGTALAMTGADIAQNEMGLSGAGVKVAIMDTGVDYNHSDLGGCFGESCRVAFGYDLVGDAFDANPNNPTYNPVPAPDNDPMDCNGHGTHVAGIVGASAASAGGVTGVAPGVTFGAYRVFGCEGSTTADIMMAAMEMALADGMDVLNMSIGAAFQWPQYPTAKASDRLVNKGMVVVASIGNSGASGLYSAGAPGLGEKVIGVASFDNSHTSLNTFTISPDDTQIGYGTAAAAPLPPTSGTYPMARTGTTATLDDACAPLPANSLDGMVALIRRGTCPFHTKAANAQAAGAAGVALYNNGPGRFSPTVAGTPAITIPVVAISDTEGALIDGRLATGPVDMTWTDQTGTFINPTGGLISSFSSYGLAPDLTLKPDIGAPGGLIRSTYPLASGGYATISGTSMSSPHVAGTVALLLEAKPNTPAQAVRAILQNSAVPKKWWGNPGLGFLDMVHRQGAGMVDIVRALEATTRVEPSKLSLGESEAGPATRTLSIKNSGASAVTYTLSHAPALSTGPNTFTVGATTGFAAVAFSAPAVTVSAGGTTSVDVTITANAALVNLGQYGGYIVVSGDDGSTIRVPYAGLKGDYQAKTVLTPTDFGFPWLSQVVGGFYTEQAIGATYTMVGNDVPFVLAHLDHQARRFRIEVQEALSGKAWHRAADYEYIGRNSTATGFFAFAFDGVTVQGSSGKTVTVPNGDYVMIVSVLKALGDGNNPAHWETWTSPAFTIARP